MSAHRYALRSLARRHHALTAELDDLDEHLTNLAYRTAPALLAVHGVGVETTTLLVAAGRQPPTSTQ